MKKITRTFERCKFIVKVYDVEKDTVENREFNMVLYDTKNVCIARYEEENNCKILTIDSEIRENVLIGVDYDVFINKGKILKVIDSEG